MLDINRYFKQYAQQCIALPYDLAYELGCAFVQAAISGDVQGNIETATVLASLNNVVTLAHPDAPNMIAGICAAVFTEDIAKSPNGFFTVPGIEHAMENCGTGGDTVVTPNVSCLAAFCAASAGITIIKHGSRSHTDSGKSGSSDFFEACGIPLRLPVERMRHFVQQWHLGYIDAVDDRFKRIHYQTMRISRVSHLNHIIGPITSPVNPTQLRRRVLGVNQTVNPMMIAKTYDILNKKGITHMEHLLLVRGFGDYDNEVMDEASITSKGTQVVSLHHGDIAERRLSASDFGLNPAIVSDLCVPVGANKGEYSRRILAGEVQGPALDLVCANAALLFSLHNPETSLAAHTKHALELFHSRAVSTHVETMRVSL